MSSNTRSASERRFERKVAAMQRVAAERAAQSEQQRHAAAKADRALLPRPNLMWWQRGLRALGWCAWLGLAAFIVMFLVAVILVVMQHTPSLKDFAKSYAGTVLMEMLFSAGVLALVVRVPFHLGRAKDWNRAERRAGVMQLLGLGRLPEKRDAGLVLLAVIGYYVVTTIFMLLLSLIAPQGLMGQRQQVDIITMASGSEKVVSFLVLVLVVPIIEELIFRGYLFGKLRPLLGMVGASLLTSLIFAVAHGQFNVAVVTFVLSMLSCCLREYTGAIWSGVGLHMVVNAVATLLLLS